MDVCCEVADCSGYAGVELIICQISFFLSFFSFFLIF